MTVIVTVSAEKLRDRTEKEKVHCANPKARDGEIALGAITCHMRRLCCEMFE